MAKLSSTHIFGNLIVDGDILNKATTSTEGVVKLNDAINSTSITEAATANAVKKAYDLAASKSSNSHTHADYLLKTGSSNLIIGTSSSTDNSNAQIEIQGPSSGIARLTLHSVGRTRLSLATISGDNLQFTAERNGVFRVLNANGYLDIGTQNGTYAHYNTDRANHWFNKTVRVAGDIYAGTNYDQKVYHTGNKPTPADIGAAASSHTHNYAGSSSAGGAATSALTCTGNSATATISNYLTSNTRMDYGWNGINYFNISGTAGSAAKANDTPTTAWWHVMRFNHANSTGYYTDLAIPFNDTSLYYKRITAGSVQNGGWIKVLDSLNYNSYVPTKTGSGASGTWGISVTGNSATATKLQTARSINGTNFDGSAAITTANWGTARTLTIGNTGKSVNGSANVSWSLSEIGAAASSHTHNAITSRGNVTAESGVAGRPAVAGLTMTQAYNNGYPTSYGNVINLRGTGDGQILVGWSGTDGAHAPVYVRSKRDNTSTANWSGWAQVYTSAFKPSAADIGAMKKGPLTWNDLKGV